MIENFEFEYSLLVSKVLLADERHTRNGKTKSVFGSSLVVNVGKSHFPLLVGRKLYPRGVIGEFAAMVRGPKHVNDFKKWGCNYWDLWANEDGSLNVDYNGFNQLQWLRKTLIDDPTNRRLIVNGWRPDRLADLSLPCCHYSYQFYVTNNNELNMIWTQRSVDVMIGLPSDIILAATWLIALAADVGLKPGFVKLDLGDCHIYKEHYEQAKVYLKNVQALEEDNVNRKVPYDYSPDLFDTVEEFNPDALTFSNYNPELVLKFKLKE